MTKPGEAWAYFENTVLPYRGEACLIWPFSRTPDGYTSIGHDGRTHTVSELACSLAHGPKPTSKHQAAHTCGNGRRGCCAPNHVRWATPAENAADKLVHGTSTRGEGNHSAKLSEADVAIIQSGKRWKHTEQAGAEQ